MELKKLVDKDAPIWRNAFDQATKRYEEDKRKWGESCSANVRCRLTHDQTKSIHPVRPPKRLSTPLRRCLLPRSVLGDFGREERR
jgi:hypothetical protein